LSQAESPNMAPTTVRMKNLRMLKLLAPIKNLSYHIKASPANVKSDLLPFTDQAALRHHVRPGLNADLA
jgi:hypothetical protein